MDTQRVQELLRTLDYGPAPESDSKARAWLRTHGAKFNHFVGGEFRPPVSGGYFETVDPSTGEKLAEIAQGTAEDVGAAMLAASAAFPSWSALSGFVRAKYLYAIARAIAKHSRLFAVLETLDNGKTVRETRDIDIPLVIRHFYYHAGLAMIQAQEFPGMRPGGVIGQIIPWNFPLLMLAWKIAPAIAAGNTVVLKPAEFTPLTALLFAEILRDEVGLPPGVVNIVTGDGKTGEAIVTHAAPWKIAFTGSTEVGRAIRKATAGSGKRLTMELGGKSPFIVLEGSDLDSVVEGVVDAIWFNQGQVCCAGSRLLVQESIRDLLVEKLKRRMAQLRGGKPLDKAKDIGAVNSVAQLEKIERLCRVGTEEGAELWQPPGWRDTCPQGGYYFPPTIFTGVQPSATIAQEEIFGPVLVVMSFRTPAEAAELANNTPYGLAASVWTQDIDTAFDLTRRVKAGTVWVNCTNAFDAASGFGGFRESGYGREGGFEGFLDVLVEEESSPPQPRVIVPATGDGSGNGTHRDGSNAIDRTHRFLVGGKLARPDGGTSYHVRSPSGALLAVASDANRKDVRNAVEAARAAERGWGDAAEHNRAQILLFLAENLADQRERFVAGIAAQTGCSLPDAEVEFDASIERLFHWAAWADKFGGTVQRVPARMLVPALNEPIGVIGIRAPDEWPLLGLVGTIGPAIAMGNTAVVVAGIHALTASDLVQAIQNSDVPGGAVNVLTAEHPDAVAKMLAEHRDVDAVWCFGSAEACAKVEAGSTSNMKRTWVGNGKPLDWMGVFGTSKAFLREATQPKNIWVPFGA